MFVGVDVGTTGVKVVVFDENGKVLSMCYRSYPLISDGKGSLMCDAKIIWEKFLESLKEAVSQIAQPQKIRTIGFSSLGEALVPIDKDGNILAYSMLGTDVRGEKEYDDFCDRFGEKRLAEITGHARSGDYSLTKVMWILANQRELYQKTWKFLLFEDFLGFMMTGETVTDYSLASRTMMFDIHRKCWSKEIADFVGFDIGKFAAPVVSGTVIGHVRECICRETGLPKDALVVTGGHDVVCALMGAGAMKPGIGIDITGTTECISAVIGAHALDHETTVRQNLVCEPFMTDNCYNTLAFSWNAGKLLEWLFQSLFQSDEMKVKNPFAFYDSKCKKKPSGLFVLPHFSKTGTLYANEKSSGAIVGLSLDTTRYDIYQAFLESITYEMKLNLQLLQNAGINIEKLTAVGGGSKSPVWLQMKANIFGKPVAILETPQAGAMGVAIAGAVCTGMYGSYEEASEKMIRIKQRYFPEKSVMQEYESQFETYRMLFPGLREINRARSRNITG